MKVSVTNERAERLRANVANLDQDLGLVLVRWLYQHSAVWEEGLWDKVGSAGADGW